MGTHHASPGSARCLRPTLLTALLLHVALPAQSFTVSPAALANVEGSHQLQAPCTFAGRWQQIHGDLRGTPMAVRGLRFRPDGWRYLPHATARSLDCELWMSWGDYGQLSRCLDDNHLRMKANVMARRRVALPDNTQSAGMPEPWNVRFPLDATYVFPGVAFDPVWELRVYGNDQSGLGYDCDAA